MKSGNYFNMVGTEAYSSTTSRSKLLSFASVEGELHQLCDSYKK